MNRGRIQFLQLLIWLGGAIVLCRLVYWQVIQSRDLSDQASRQQQSQSSVPAPRGEIVSRDGQPLVTNRETYTLISDPAQLSGISDTGLLDIVPLPSELIDQLKQAKLEGKRWLPLASGLTPDQVERINGLNISGLYPQFYPERTYPEGSSSSHLLGFVGKDQLGQPKGFFGLEGYYDRVLTGRPGQLIRERDALNRAILIGPENSISAQPGRSLQTSIDRSLQFILHRKLTEGLKRYQASAGTVSVLNPHTGAVLAMVSLPDYDPAFYHQYPGEVYRNPVVSQTYEPGSTFKTVVMASALDAGVLTPDTKCTICSGPVIIGDKRVGSWNDKYFPGSTMRDVILHSDNVGMVNVSRLLGREKMLEYLRRFGVGSATGIDLEGETVIPFRPDNQWYEIDLATASFGQGIALTPIQMLRAVSVIANGGYLVQPRVVDKIWDGREFKPVQVSKKQRVISSSAAAQTTLMMINGVDKGEVRYYKPIGYSIAGKTGTAQVAIEGHYDKNKTIASFVGFAPADQPEFVMLVTLNDPQTSPWGSTTAAPLWFDIARQIFSYLRIPPSGRL